MTKRIKTSSLSNSQLLPSSAIAEFKQIYLDEFKLELPNSEALLLASNFLQFTKTIYKPISKHDKT